MCADSCRRDRHHACSAGDIENILSGPSIGELHQTRRRGRRPRLKWREMFPALSLRFFEFGNHIFAHGVLEVSDIPVR